MLDLLEIALAIVFIAGLLWIVLEIIVGFAVDSASSTTFGKRRKLNLRMGDLSFRRLEESDDLSDNDVIIVRDENQRITTWYRHDANLFGHGDNFVTFATIVRMISEQGLDVGFPKEQTVSLKAPEVGSEGRARPGTKFEKKHSSSALVFASLVISPFIWMLLADSRISREKEIEEVNQNASVQLEEKAEEFAVKLSEIERRNEALSNAVTRYCDEVVYRRKDTNSNEEDLCGAADVFR